MKQTLLLNLKKNYLLVFLFLLCIPLLFINIKNSHDWGDDFASYIHQAKNIIEGIPQSSLGYVLNQDSPGIGPPAYPIGFPLLLAPVYYFFGNNISAFTGFLSILLIIAVLLMYRFFKFYFSTLTSFFLVLIIIYNPWTLNFKMEVMSEIPFTLLFLVIIIFYHQKKEARNYLFFIIMGLLGGFLMSIRAVGSVFVMAVFYEILCNLYRYLVKKKRDNSLKKLIVQKFIVISLSISLYLFLNLILFKVPSSGLYYTSLLTFNSLSQIIRDNLTYYFDVFKGFFTTENADWRFAPLFTSSAMLTFAVIGFFKKVSAKFDFVDLVVLLYCLLVLIYPFGNAGFRFILPIAPVLFYYALLTVKDINIPFKLVNRKVIILLIGTLILVQYKVSIEKIINQRNEVLWGPQEENAAEAFSYIKNNIPENAVIDFVKPRALALYAERNSYHMKINQSMPDIRKNITYANISFLLYTDEPINFFPDDSLKKYVSLTNNNLVCEWSNSKFRLYKIVR